MMQNGLTAIIKKEFTRFFTDRRMVITTVLLPGLLFYLIYSFMGSALGNMFAVEEDYRPSIYAVDAPPSVVSMLAQAGMPVIATGPEDVAAIQQRIQDKEVDLLMIFPADFESTLAARNDLSPLEYRPPNVELFYNSSRTESSMAFGVVSSLLEAYRNALYPSFVMNSGGAGNNYNLATEQDAIGFMFASMLPMLILIFLYSGCIGVAPESIAGEKERGTIATLLVTPLKRWQLALGKVLSLGVFALLAGASSFVAVMLSLPKIVEAAASAGSAGSGGEGSPVGLALYGAQDYLILLAVIMSTVLLFIGLISIISAFAKSVREANTMIMPLMIVVMLVGVTGMFSAGAQSELWYYLVPAYNSVQCFIGVFSYTADPLFVVVTVLVNLALTGVCVFALTKMFNSEKIVFAR